jgi:hypothetical protein
MTNLVINRTCNLRCRYCFAGRPDRQRNQGVMSLQQLDGLLDALQRADIGEARLVGGEPTLNPQFNAMVEHALARGLRVVVFSNGLMPDAVLRLLESKSDEQVALLINTLRPQHQRSQEQRIVLSRLGLRATLGFNIDHPGVELGFLVDLALEHGLSPTIRLGLAHPTVGDTNRFLHPRHYPAVGLRILALAEQAEVAGLAVRLDCGFVPCMFPPSARGLLGDATGDLGNSCTPIPDLLASGEAIPCFPLAELSQLRLNKPSIGQLRERFSEELAPLGQVGIYRACRTCRDRAEGSCSGGCIAAAVRRLHPRIGFSGHRGDFDRAKIGKQIHE